MIIFVRDDHESISSWNRKDALGAYPWWEEAIALSFYPRAVMSQEGHQIISDALTENDEGGGSQTTSRPFWARPWARRLLCMTQGLLRGALG